MGQLGLSLTGYLHLPPRQQRVTPERDDCGFLTLGQNRRARPIRSSLQVFARCRLGSFRGRLRVDALVRRAELGDLDDALGAVRELDGLNEGLAATENITSSLPKLFSRCPTAPGCGTRRNKREGFATGGGSRNSGGARSRPRVCVAPRLSTQATKAQVNRPDRAMSFIRMDARSP